MAKDDEDFQDVEDVDEDVEEIDEDTELGDEVVDDEVVDDEVVDDVIDDFEEDFDEDAELDDEVVDEDDDDDDEETEEALDELEAEELELLDDEVSESMLVDEAAELRAIRREELTLNVEAQAQRSDEFVCQSCFLVKRTSQLANRRKMICFDCAS